jgi:hypothetical protein
MASGSLISTSIVLSCAAAAIAGKLPSRTVTWLSRSLAKAKLIQVNGSLMSA